MHILKKFGVRLGDIVILGLSPDPNPDVVELPEELVEALAQDEQASERFYGFSPGKQRGLVTYMNDAKRPETRVKRALELTHKLRTHTLYGDRNYGKEVG